MPNPLQSTAGAIPAQEQPNPQQQGGQPAPAGAPQQMAPPVLSHEETVAALRHFHAIQEELEALLTNPGLGKSDIKSSIIDGTTKLVAQRILTPAAAVAQLSSVPDKPLEQRKWVQQHYETTVTAQAAVLEHHRAGGPGTQDWALESEAHKSDPDKHIEVMSGLMGRYKGPNSNG